MKVDEMINVMAAYANGEDIEFHDVDEDLRNMNWSYVASPTWDWRKYEYRIAPSKKESSRFMTNRQLSELLQKGYGTWSDQNALSLVHAGYSYALSKENDIVTDKCIRPWGSDEWLEPTVDIYEEFMNRKEKERRYQNIKISIKKLNGNDFEVESEPEEETIKDYSDCGSVEPKIGEVFRFKGLTLRCEEGGCSKCFGCDIKDFPCCFFECVKATRADEKGVCFVDVSKTENTTASEDSSATQKEGVGVHKRTPQEIADFFNCYVAYDSSIGSFSTYEKPPVFSGEFCWIVSDRFVATTDSCKEKHIIYRPHLEPIVMEVEDD